jgi:predicted RNase H-related nuclease YkuK (DUF458 family)
MTDSILEKQWRTLHKQKVSNIVEEVAALSAEGPRPIHIGTDAQKRGRNTDFVTAVVVLDPGHGGRVFYAKTRMEHIHSLQHKLFTEVGLSLEIALALCEVVSAEQIEVHVDANTNLKWESANYHQQLAGMVVSHGFKAHLKPDSWCASHVADHAVNCKNETAVQRKVNRKKNKKRR